MFLSFLNAGFGDSKVSRSLQLKSSFFIAILIVWFAGAYAEQTTKIDEQPVYGIWYEITPDITEKTLKSDFEKIRDIGFNTVFFSAYVHQDNMFSNTVKPPDEKGLASLRAALKAAKAAGLKRAVTGFLLVDDGAWRGTIVPTNKKKWGESYFNAILPYINLAQEEGVEMFCVASEMETLKQDGEMWKRMMAEIRKRFGGLLGYNTNWWYNDSGFETLIKQKAWLSELDFLGVSAYFNLSKENNPTADELARKWRSNASGRDTVADVQKLRTEVNDKIIFWEIGYMSLDGANMEPWNYNRKADADAEEQADCFTAFLRILKETGFINGFAVWGPRAGLQPSEKGYDFIGKPAENVFRKFLLNRQDY